MARKLIKDRWNDEKVKLEECFAWLSSWKNAPTHTITGVQELYQQLLPTKVYYNRKTKSQCKLLMKNTAYAEIPWRMCSTFYLAVVHWHRLSTYRDNNALNILFFEVLRSLDLITKVEP